MSMRRVRARLQHRTVLRRAMLSLMLPARSDRLPQPPWWNQAQCCTLSWEPTWQRLRLAAVLQPPRRTRKLRHQCRRCRQAPCARCRTPRIRLQVRTIDLRRPRGAVSTVCRVLMLPRPRTVVAAQGARWADAALALEAAGLQAAYVPWMHRLTHWAWLP